MPFPATQPTFQKPLPQEAKESFYLSREDTNYVVWNSVAINVQQRAGVINNLKKEEYIHNYMNDEKCFLYRASTLKGRAGGELCSQGSHLFVRDENPRNEVESVAFSLTFPP